LFRERWVNPAFVLLTKVLIVAKILSSTESNSDLR